MQDGAYSPDSHAEQKLATSEGTVICENTTNKGGVLANSPLETNLDNQDDIRAKLSDYDKVSLFYFNIP